MASSKDIYEAQVYAANMYAAGVFRGIGVSAAIRLAVFHPPLHGPDSRYHDLNGPDDRHREINGE